MGISVTFQRMTMPGIQERACLIWCVHHVCIRSNHVSYLGSMERLLTSTRPRLRKLKSIAAFIFTKSGEPSSGVSLIQFTHICRTRLTGAEWTIGSLALQHFAEESLRGSYVWRLHSLKLLKAKEGIAVRVGHK